MKIQISVIRLFFLILLTSVFLCSCKQTSSIHADAEQSSTDGSNLLTTENFIDIFLSAPEGSGAIRTLTLHYKRNGEKEFAEFNNLTRLDCKDYNDESKEQTLTDSDFDQDGIVEIIVYQEFWFPDITLAHVEIPLWPTIYEYDLNKGFVVASAKYKDYFKMYAKKTAEELDSTKDMSNSAKLALKRLIYAAERIADGSFIPSSPYSNDPGKNYYTDVYELVKNITE